jgi:Family of unknown function (DUF5519)
MSVREELERRLGETSGLVRLPARRGPGSVYLAGNQEIVHFHGDERMDVRLTRERIPELKAQGAFDERVRTRGPSADWVAVRVSVESDLPMALRLVKEAIRGRIDE